MSLAAYRLVFLVLLGFNIVSILLPVAMLIRQRRIVRSEVIELVAAGSYTSRFIAGTQKTAVKVQSQRFGSTASTKVLSPSLVEEFTLW